MKRRTILQLILILPFIKISHFIKTFYKKKNIKITLGSLNQMIN